MATCYTPLNAWQSSPGAPVAFSPMRNGKKLRIPCGQCIGCRLRRSQEWAARCIHEAQLHKQNTFLTLTYERVPYGGTLVKRHVQLFMKRLRRLHSNRKIRFYAVGEYGETTKRPHYHLLLFNYWPRDAEFLKEIGGNRYFTSNELSMVWPRGHHMAGHVTFDSAAYCARYCTKKITGKAAQEHYESLVAETGEVIQREPEFAVMSRRPGIGKEWFAKYRDSVFPHDDVIVKGRQIKPPRYYDKLFEFEDQCGFDKVKAVRTQRALESTDTSTQRLRDREKCTEARLKLKKRSYD